MATKNDKPKTRKGEWLRRGIAFVFGFENKTGDVLDYQISHVDGFSCSPQEFYTNVEQQLADRKIPSIEISRQEFSEGGTLSDKRIYLRLMRERLAITTCAAPFGSAFFFSCRTVYVPALVRLWHILAIIVFFYIAARLLIIPLGFTFAIVAVIALLLAVAGVMRNASAAGFSGLDAILLRIPVVATIYENWFREETYYREDTRNLYLKLVPQIIQELVEETCAAKGVKLVSHFQPAPPVVNLNKPLPPDKRPATT